MQLPILIEPIEGGRFRARSGEPLPLSTEAATRDEAVRQLEKLLADRLRDGSELRLARMFHQWSAEDVMQAGRRLAGPVVRRSG
jgi:hypothetical protein